MRTNHIALSIYSFILTRISILLYCAFAFIINTDENDRSGNLPDALNDPNAGRFVRYQFTDQFLRLRVVGATYVMYTVQYLLCPFILTFCVQSIRFSNRIQCTRSLLFRMRFPRITAHYCRAYNALFISRLSYNVFRRCPYCILVHVCRVEFTVGQRPVNNFRMLERHYFGDRMLKSFTFEFGFCMPNSVRLSFYCTVL